MRFHQLIYQIKEQNYISENDAATFIELLIKQGKVTIPSIETIQTCNKIVLCYADNKLIGIGALKLRKSSALKKAGLADIEDIFSLELGYFFVNEAFRGLGVSTAIARLLLMDKIDDNICATTELYVNNPMMKTLEKLGFKHYGIPWRSIWHDGTIGMFLKFKKGVKNEKALSN